MQATGERQRVLAGSAETLRHERRLLAKLGHVPIVVFWHDDHASAIEDRCPHLGFPLHQGTVEAGLVTCHWHHARFDLASGCTLEPWADDANAFDVTIEGDEVWVSSRPVGEVSERLRARLRDGLEHQLTLVIAKATLGLLEQPGGPDEAMRTALEFGLTNRAGGWGSGLTTLMCLANVVDDLDPSTRAAAIVHGIRAVADDCAGQPARFRQRPLTPSGVADERLSAWFRRSVDARNADAAERVLATAASQGRTERAAAMLMAAVTDHVFIDDGHVLDFANKALEAIERYGDDLAPSALTSLVSQLCSAYRSEEGTEWRYPVDLAGLVDEASRQLLSPGVIGVSGVNGVSGVIGVSGVNGVIGVNGVNGVIGVNGALGPAGATADAFDAAALAWSIVDGEPADTVAAIVGAARTGVPAVELARAVAYAAALRLDRFHVQNDVADWNTVHHTFTAANALHAALERHTSPELARGLVQVALRVHLDRFLNVPVARHPDVSGTTLADLDACWQRQGQVDRAGALVHQAIVTGEPIGLVVGALVRAVLAEDAGFHWYQVVEAAARQASLWPAGSEEAANILAGAARFVAAHTPTRRELPTVIRTAVRLRRGDRLEDGSGSAMP